jgi:transcriptional regulator with XRE-family HTH domain
MAAEYCRSRAESQISRIERNPDRTTVRTLKRIARALNVSVSSLP